MSKSAYEISVLNITLQPHSPELYVKLFDDVFSVKPAISSRLYGKDHISLKLIEKIKSENNVVEAIYGTIQKYTVIDSDDWYDRDINSKTLEGEEPEYDLERFSPYYKSFDFIFMPNGHRMFIVTRLKKETLSISRVCNSIKRLFNTNFIVEKYNEVSVSVETDSATIEKILSIDKIEKLFINVSLDNGDDNYDLKDNVLGKMRQQNVRKEVRSLVGEKGQSIKPNEETIALMELSLSNGHTSAYGIKNGMKVTEKTINNPITKKDIIDLDKITTKEILLSYAKEIINFLTTRQSR